MKETSQQVDAQIGETFTLVLTPSQEPGTNEVTWQTTRAGAAGDLADRVSKKLGTEEKLIPTYGGVRVKMDLDRFNLWSDRNDISVADLWAQYARFPYMPRVASFRTLAEAISDGTANLNWSDETFGYAEAHDDEAWVGVRTAQHVTPQRSGLLVHPDHVPAPKSAETDDGDAGSGDAAGTDGTPGEVGHKQFYALFDLDGVRAIRQMGEIMEHVVQRLGPDVELSLEIRATSDDGFDDATRRVVSENASNLGSKSVEFE